MVFKDEIINELYLAYTESKALIPMDEFELLFESDEGGDASEKKEANEKVKTSAVGHLKNALSAIAKLISALASKISNWLQEKSLDKEEREAYEQFKEACKADPSLRNKKITVKDYEKIKADYEAIEKEAERLDMEYKSGRIASAKEFLKHCEDFCANASKGAAAAIAMNSALNMAHKSRAYAQKIDMALKSDRRIIEALAEQVGEANAAKFEREIEIYTNRATIRRAILKVRGKMYDTTLDCFSATYKDAKSIFKNRLGEKSINSMIDAGKAKQLDTLIKGNKELNDVIGAKGALTKAHAKGNIKGHALGKVDEITGSMSAKDVARREAKGDYSQSSLGSVLYHDVKDSVAKLKKK